jgi:hypothetical protein
MYDPKRLFTRVFVLLALAWVLCLVGVAIRPVVGGRPSWLPDSESTVEVPALRRAAGRVVAAGSDLRRSTLGPEHLGVLIGGSSLIHGVDPERMDTGADWRWLSLAPAGAYLRDDCKLADLALEGSVRPGALVFFFTPAHLALLPTILDDTTIFDTGDLSFHLRRHEWFKAQTDVANLILIPWNRVFPNRTRISSYLRELLLDAQQNLFRSMGYALLAPFAPDPTPWTVAFPYPGAEHMPDGWMEFVYRGLEKNHLFEPSRYPADSQGLRSLAGTIRRARWLGTEIIIVLMAESSEIRSKTPREPETRLREALHREFGNSGPTILDLRDALDDGAFLDALHTTEHGRATFTGILSNRLRPVLSPPDGTAPDRAVD